MSNACGSRGARQLSPKAAQLYWSLLDSFNARDRANFAHILDHYQRTKNIQQLAQALNAICCTPQQREEIYPLLRSLIPRNDRERFDYECTRPRSAYNKHYPTFSKKRLPKYQTTRSLPEHFGYPWSGSSLDSGLEPSVKSSSRLFETRPRGRREKKTSAGKVVLLERDRDGGERFGFSIRGGAEHNVGLFVSSIDEGSVAERAGLCLGDQIIEANRMDFTNLSHQEAVEIIQQTANLHLLVKSVGKIPGTFKSSSSYRWIDPCGKEVSPPREYTKASLLLSDMHKSKMRLLGDDDERKVNLFVADGAELGLKIRGGIEHGLGIFIASVDPNSGAERAGFQVGDQILDVNGTSFLDITHKEAVEVLKSAQRMVITLKDIGVLPHGKKVHDETRWIREARSKPLPRPESAEDSEKKTSAEETSVFYETMGSTQLTHHSVVDHSEDFLETKARKVLPSNELRAFTFYVNEYKTSHLSLTSFISALSDLLRSPTKDSLFREVRSVILPRDLAKFDEWMEKRENQKARDMENKQVKQDKQSLNSEKSSDSSTNSWLGLFENGAHQRKRSNPEDHGMSCALPDPPSDLQNHPWETVSNPTHPDKTQHLMTFEDFPPPPIFVTQNEDIPKERTTKDNQNRLSTSALSLADLPPPPALPRRTQQMNNHVLLNQKTLPISGKTASISNFRDKTQVRSAPYAMTTDIAEDEETEDGLYSAVSFRVPSGLSLNASSHTKNAPATVTAGLLDDEDTEDGQYTVVKYRDTRGWSNNVFSSVAVHSGIKKTDHAKKTNHKNVLKKNKGLKNKGDQIPIYASVDKSSRRNNTASKNKNKTSKLEEIEQPPPVPERRYNELEVEALLGSDRKHSQNGDSSRNEAVSSYEQNQFEDFCKSSNKTPSQIQEINSMAEEFSQDFSPNAINSQNSEPCKETIKSFPERIREFDETAVVHVTRNAGSTQHLNKANNSRSKISQTEEEEEEMNHRSKTFVVELTKHTSNLGLSITGGTDTESKEIRIKSIKRGNTVAGSCPLLKAGQIILGVDEKSLQSVTSGIAAMAIRQAFNSDKSVLKLILENDSRECV